MMVVETKYYPARASYKTTKLDPMWYLDSFVNEELMKTVRIHLPDIIARQITEVQPMSNASGDIFRMVYVSPVWYKRYWQKFCGAIWNVEPCCVCEGCACFGMGHQFETCWKHKHVKFENLRIEQAKYHERV